jgi:hypothetical protein
MVHVPCIKTSGLLKIYRYFPSLIPILCKTRVHDLTIKQFLNFQDSQILKSTYEDFFDHNNLDHEQTQEALFSTDTADLIAINNDWNFQVLTQKDLVNCVQLNYVYLCDIWEWKKKFIIIVNLNEDQFKRLD